MASNYSPLEKQQLITYWVPVAGHPEYYLHFSVRIVADYESKAITVSSLPDFAREFYAFDPDFVQE